MILSQSVISYKCVIYITLMIYMNEEFVREMQKHNDSASEHGICDESEVPELTS